MFIKIETLQLHFFLLKSNYFFQGTFLSDSIAVRISGNLNMANVSSLSNRIESEINEIFPDHIWLNDKVWFFSNLIDLILNFPLWQDQLDHTLITNILNINDMMVPA